jgi:hypothetical protein
MMRDRQTGQTQRLRHRGPTPARRSVHGQAGSCATPMSEAGGHHPPGMRRHTSAAIPSSGHTAVVPSYRPKEKLQAKCSEERDNKCPTTFDFPLTCFTSRKTLIVIILVVVCHIFEMPRLSVKLVAASVNFQKPLVGPTGGVLILPNITTKRDPWIQPLQA